jgi:hypothetical protein
MHRWRSFGFALTIFSLAPDAIAQPIPGGPDELPPATTTAGLGHGFTVRPKDDSFSVNIRVRGQFQGFVETNPDPNERTDVGFMVRRMRLVFQGHVYDKDIRYYIQFGFSPRDQEPDLLVPIRDAQLLWTGLRDLNLRVGQMKVPFNRERVISSSALAMVDRSNVNAELTLDRDIGVMVQSRDLFGLHEVLRYNLGVFGGDGRNRTTPNTGLLYVGRLEVAPFGGFDDYSEVDFKRSPKPRLAIGFATAYSDSTPRARATTGDTLKAGTLDYRHGEADMIFKIAGLSLQSEVLFRKSAQTVLTSIGEDGKPITEYPRSAWGFMAQASWLMGPHWEPSLRYGEVRPMDSSNPNLLRDREIGGGLSYYFHKHDLKVQFDYFHLLTDAADVVLERDRVRLQTQFYF